jgi:hypothetical protein
MQRSRSTSQLRLTGSLLALVDTQLNPQSCKHWLNKVWQFTEQLNCCVCAILFFGMGVKLPAKLLVIEENKIIAATIRFICTPP